MNTLIRTISALALTLILPVVYADPAINLMQPAVPSNAIQNNLQTAIDQTIKSLGDNPNIGIVVENLNTGMLLYAKNKNRFFMPASNQKLFTAFAALQYLGSNYTYQTKLFADVSKAKDGVLDDNVVIQFSGDPTFTFAKLEQLVAGLNKSGIRKINGSVIIDDTIFDTVTMSPGTSWDDQSYCFGAPVHGIIMDHNCVRAALRPSAKVGRPALLMLPTTPQFIRFTNHAVTAEANAPCKPYIDTNLESNYILGGCVKANDPLQEFIVPIHNPRAYLEAALIYLLNKNSITYTGEIRFAKVSVPVIPFATVASEPLQTIVNSMLKDSDNLIANALYKTLGASVSQGQGNWRNGRDAIHQILAGTLHQDFSQIPLIDGSGNSRYNFVTPAHLINLMHYVYNQPYRNAFIAALPISGVDGTLKERMKGTHLIGKVYAKTGSMTAITSLSGFLITKNQQTLLFTIMINGFVGADSPYKALEDKICELLYELA